jgi:hypothetical protein
MSDIKESSAFGNAEIKEDKYKDFTREELFKEINKGCCKIANIQASKIENPFDKGTIDIVSRGDLYIHNFFKGKSLYKISETPIELLKQVLREKDVSGNKSTYLLGTCDKDELTFMVNLLCPKEISCDLENTKCVFRDGVVSGNNGQPVYKSIVTLENENRTKTVNVTDYDLLVSKIKVLKDDHIRLEKSEDSLELELLKCLHNQIIENGYMYLDEIHYTTTGRKFTSANLYIHNLLPIDKILGSEMNVYEKIELCREAFTCNIKQFTPLKNLSSRELAVYMCNIGGRVLVKGSKTYGVAETKVIFVKDKPKVSISFSIMKGHLELEGTEHRRKDIGGVTKC